MPIMLQVCIAFLFMSIIMNQSPKKLKNHWLDKSKERNLLKIIEWAHRQDKIIENLTAADIKEAIKSYMREASHAS